MKYLPILLLSVITLSGCDSILLHNTQQYEEAAIAQAELDAEKEEKSKQLTTAVVDVLKDENEEEASAYSKLALNFAVQDQLLEGFPINPIPVDEYVELAISNNQNDIDRLSEKISLLEKDVSQFRKEKQHNEIVLDERAKELIKLGKLYEEEHKEKIWKRAWTWAVSTLGIGGVIALAVLFPAIIPIFAQMLGAVVRIIPSLASAFGVAATSTVDAIVKGVQGARKQIKNGGDRTYSRDEVLAILDGNLDFHQKKSDRTLIAKRKSKHEI